MMKRTLIVCGLILAMVSSARAIEPLTPVSEPGQYAFSLEVERDAQPMEVSLRQGTALYRGRPDFSSTRVMLRADYAVMPWTTIFLRLGTADMDGGNFTIADLNGGFAPAWGGGLSVDFKNEFLIPGVHWGGSVYYNGFKSDLQAGDLDVTEYGGSLRMWKAVSPVILYTGPGLNVREVKINTIGSGVAASGEAETDEKFIWAGGLRYDLTKEIAMNLEGEVIGRKSIGMSLVYRFGDTLGPMAVKRRDRPVETPPWMPKEKEEEIALPPKEEAPSSSSSAKEGDKGKKEAEPAEEEKQSPPGLFKIPSLPKFGVKKQKETKEAKKEEASSMKSSPSSKAPAETETAVVMEAPKIKEMVPPGIKETAPESKKAEVPPSKSILAEAPAASSSPSASIEAAAPKVDLTALKTQANEAYGNGRYQQAAEIYEKILSADPNNYQAAYNQGTCYYRLRRWAEAESAYKRASEIDPMNIDAKLYLGFSRFRQGNRDGAAEAWKRVLEIDPKNTTARSNLSAIGRL